MTNILLVSVWEINDSTFATDLPTSVVVTCPDEGVDEGVRVFNVVSVVLRTLLVHCPSKNKLSLI